MEVDGRKNTKESEVSAGASILHCEPCDGEGERNEADGYCKQCQEYLCKPCIKLHRRGKLGKLHEISEGDAMPTTRTPTEQDDSTENEICPIHKTTKEPIKFYCSSHDDIGCGDCIDYIEDASKGFKDSREFKEILTSISTLEQHIKDCENTIKDISKANADVKQTALDSIRQFRAEFITYFDKREQELMAEIEKMKAEDDKLLADLRSKGEDSKKKLEEIKREIEKKQEETKHLFITAQRRKHDLVHLMQLVSDSLKEVKSRRRHYKFNRNMDIGNIMTSKTPLGKLDVSSMSTTLDLVKARCIPCNDIDINTSEDTTKCRITGLAFLKPDVLVLADCNNKAVKVVDITTKKVKFCLKLSSRPYDLTILPDQQIAVTMCDEPNIQILATHNNVLSKLREFKVPSKCRGIDYKLGKLSVSYFSPAKVEIMDTKHPCTLYL